MPRKEQLAVIESEEKLKTSDQQKEKIRKRYKGISQDELEVIPALPQEELYDETKEKRVAVYARVSTDDPRQTSSYELQKNHYEDVVSRKPGWNLIKIYADEGISGTSLKHRDAFVEMIEDCRAGKIDLILTKSVSRFARNVLDCIGYVRQLAAMSPPIGIFFEAENLYTLDKNSEMALSFISTLAQEESHNKSEIMNASIEMRFSRGIFLTPPLLGYDQDEEGNLIINEEEAKTVRLIFFMFLFGNSCQQIADKLTELGRTTKRGRTQWSVSSVLSVLRNERHCGDVLARKTFTPNYLDHKSKVNRQDRNQYRQMDNHEAIISRTDFIKVQHMLDLGGTGGKSILPELHVIEEGILKGFITVNPTWAGFKKDSYMKAYAAVFSNSDANPEKETTEETETTIKALDGSFDLRGYQVTSGQFFNTSERITITFTYKNIRFNSLALEKLGESAYIELLVQPHEKLFAVRESGKEKRCSLKWFNCSNKGRVPRSIGLKACMPAMFDIMGWNADYKYKLTGQLKSNGKSRIIVFDSRESEMLIPKSIIDQNKAASEATEVLCEAHNTVTAYSQDLADSFGKGYYAHSQQKLTGDDNGSTDWDISNEGTAVEFEEKIQSRDREEIREDINKVMSEIRKDQDT